MSGREKFLGIVPFIIVAVAFVACGGPPYPEEPAVDGPLIYESKERPDMLDSDSPDGLKVVQITTDMAHPSHHVYMESHIFTPDSKRFVFYRYRGTNFEGGDRSSQDLWLCDIDNDFALRQLTDEEGAKGPSITPDGLWMYYLVDQTVQGGGGELRLKRVSLKNFKRQTLLVLDGTVPGAKYYPNRVYGLSSISSDGKRLCTGAFLGDGKTENAPWGILVFDLEKPDVSLIVLEADYCNIHPQYCRSKDPEASHDILVQHNHGSVVNAQGGIEVLHADPWADIHVIRDDGTNWRDCPFGRDGKEACQGHQAWRGEQLSVVSSTVIRGGGGERILDGFAYPANRTTGHKGCTAPEAKYVDLTRNIEKPSFGHFGLDPSGNFLVSDSYAWGRPETGKLFIGRLTEGDNPELIPQFLFTPKSTWEGQRAHPHPFLSPDTKMAFFNSDEPGQPQIWMTTGYTFPE
ncbi:hypothetical protein ACFLT7_08360 [candidate division KSB1 bacterium]